MATRFEERLARERLGFYTDPANLAMMRSQERSDVATDLAIVLGAQERRIIWRGVAVVAYAAFAAGVAWIAGQWATVGVICQ